jgi:hypothetical protein
MFGMVPNGFVLLRRIRLREAGSHFKIMQTDMSPFEKLGPDKYRGPSGKVFSRAQVKLYYSRGGTFKKNRKSKK